ncbi:MAG: hypothetical protein AB7H96_03655 [Vicinamibacterales bacterium]
MHAVLEHRIEQDARLIVITGSAAPAVGAARSSIDELAGDPRLCEGFGVLILVAPEALPPAGLDVIRMSGLLTALTQLVDGPVAIVVSAPPQVLPASMMSLAGDRGHRVECFTREADARTWLRTQLLHD